MRTIFGWRIALFSMFLAFHLVFQFYTKTYASYGRSFRDGEVQEEPPAASSIQEPELRDVNFEVYPDASFGKKAPLELKYFNAITKPRLLDGCTSVIKSALRNTTVNIDSQDNKIFCDSVFQTILESSVHTLK